MSLTQYKNAADVKESKSTINGLRYTPTDASLLISEKARAFENPTDQTIDYAVEMHVYTPDGTWISGDHRLESADIPDIASRRPKLQIDIEKEITELGIERGSYKLVFNFIKNLLGNTENRSVFIKDIAPNRKEVWLTLADPLQTEIVPDDDIRVTLGRQFRRFRFDTNRRYGNGYSNLVLNLGNNNIFKVVNARIGGETIVEDSLEAPLGKGQNIYLKLYDKLPSEIVPKQRAWIAQEDMRPRIESVNIYPKPVVEEFNTIKGPNFDIDKSFGLKTETDFKTWNELLDTTTSTTQEIIDRYFSGSLSGIDVNVDYSKFDNFVYYSSAEERIKNFRYKLQLIEHYDTQNYILDAAQGSDSGSLRNNRSINTKRKNEVIGGFDAFERWAYNEQTSSLFTHAVSGSTLYAQEYCIKPYPKFIQSGDFVRHHTTSSLGLAWFDGLISSGSLYDLENENSLANTIPENVSKDPQNDQYTLFVNMIGHHFDILHTYIRELTKIHSREEHPKLGVPGELLYDVAKSMGWSLANGNQAEALWQYKLGKTVSGSFQSTGSLFSKSGESMTQEVWRRIVNNLPYLLKTKGTKRSIYALMNTYGIPQTLLSIREYGGPKQEEQKPDFIEDRFSYAINMNPGANIEIGDTYVTDRTGIYPDLQNDIPIQTHQFRFRPGMTSSMLLMSKGFKSTNGKIAPNWQLALQHTASYSGSGKYGRLHFAISTGHGRASASQTEYIPIFDGNFWNVTLGYTTTGDHFNTGSNIDTTYVVRCQQASDYITGKVVHTGSLKLTPSTGSHAVRWSQDAPTSHKFILGGSTGSAGTLQSPLFGALSESFKVTSNRGNVVTTGIPGTYAYPTAVLGGVFSGSMQEYRQWIEEIDKSTLDIHTLNPTSYEGALSTTSSYGTLVRHYPLGTDTIAVDHSTGAGLFITSSHPNQEIQDWSDPFTDGFNIYATASNFDTPATSDLTTRGNYERVIETYYVQAPSMGGTNTKSQKIRIEDNKLIGRLDPEASAERSTADYATLDSNKLGIFYSVGDQINKDIYNQLGGISLDNFIGDPQDEHRSFYPRLQDIAYEYWKKYSNRNDINAFIRVFSLFDFSLFSQIKQMIPARASSAVGLLIEPNILERAKVELSKRPVKEEPFYEQRIDMAEASMSSDTRDISGELLDPRQESGSVKITLSNNTEDLREIIPLAFSDQRNHPSMSFQNIGQRDTRTGAEIRTAHISGAQWSASSEIPSNTGPEPQYQASLFEAIAITSQSSFTPSDYDLKNFEFKRTVVNGLGTFVYTGSLRSNSGPIVLTDYQRDFHSRRDGGMRSGSDVNVVDYVRNQGESSAFQAIVLEQRKYDNNAYSRKNFYYGPKDDVNRYYKLDGWHPSGLMLDHSQYARHSMFYYYVSASSNSGPLGFGENGNASRWNEGGSAQYIGMKYRFLEPTGTVASNHFIPAEHEYWQGNLMHFKTYIQPGDGHLEGNYTGQGQNLHTGRTGYISHTASGSADTRVKHGQRGAQAIKIPRIGGGSGSRGSDFPWTMTWLMKQCSGSRNHEVWVFGWNSAHDKTEPPVADTAPAAYHENLSGQFGGYLPAIGIDRQNRLFLRDQAASFWYPRQYTSSIGLDNPANVYASPENFYRLNGRTNTSGSNKHGENTLFSIGNPYGFNRENLNHYAITYKPSGSLGIMTFYVNGKYFGEQRKDISVGANPYRTGSFFFDSIGQGYAHANGWTYGFSGSLGQLRYYERCLSQTEVEFSNKYPHYNPKVDKEGRVIFTRANASVAARGRKFIEIQNSWTGPKAKNMLFKTTTDYPFLPSSSSLEETDYAPDEKLSAGMKRIYFEGSKITGPDFNINTTQTTDGGPVVSFTVGNSNQLATKEGPLRVS